MSEVWSDVASADPVMVCVMIASCWASAVASEFSERMLTATEASIGAATLALAATAPLIGAARSASRSTFTSTLSRSPLSRSPVSSWFTVSVTSSRIAPTLPTRLPAASRTWPVSGFSAPITVPAEFTTLPVAPSRMPTTLPAESSTVVPSTRSVTVPTTLPTVLSTSPVSGSRMPTTLPEASTTLPVAASSTPSTLPSAPATVAPSTRSVTVPMRVPAESTTTPVVSLSVPTMVPSEDTTLPVAPSRVPRTLPAASTTTLPSTGPLAAAAGGVRGVEGARGVADHVARPGGGGHHRRRGLARTVGLRDRGGAHGGVALVDGAVLDAGRDGVGLDALRELDALVGQRLRGRAVAQQVGADGGVDGGDDVGVERDREVDGGGAVDGQVHVGGEVEDGDDLLVRQCRGAFARQLLGGQGCEVVASSCCSLPGNRAGAPPSS